jgi:hypothetical protein
MRYILGGTLLLLTLGYFVLKATWYVLVTAVGLAMSACSLIFLLLVLALLALSC